MTTNKITKTVISMTMKFIILCGIWGEDRHEVHLKVKTCPHDWGFGLELPLFLDHTRIVDVFFFFDLRENLLDSRTIWCNVTLQAFILWSCSKSLTASIYGHTLTFIKSWSFQYRLNLYVTSILSTTRVHWALNALCCVVLGWVQPTVFFLFFFSFANKSFCFLLK